MNTKGFQKIGQVLTKNSPTILTGLSVAGLISTVIMAVKATPKAIELINDAEYERVKIEGEENFYNGPGLSNKDIIQATWKCYAPTVVMGLGTIACMIGATSINLRRNAALASIYSLSEAALKEYQSKVVETIGKGKEQKIRSEVIKDRLTNNPVRDEEVILTGRGETLCYDSFSGRYFKSDINHIKRALVELSRDMISEMEVSLNQVYDALDLRHIKLGDSFVWHIEDGSIEPIFDSMLTEDGRPCLVLDIVVSPRYCYGD